MSRSARGGAADLLRESGIEPTRLGRRTCWFVLGIAINSLGITFVTKAALGTGQISCVPYVWNLAFPQMSFGLSTFIVNMLFIVGEVALLRRDFRPLQFLQIAVNLLFSSLLDIDAALLSSIGFVGLPVRLLAVASGCVALAFGICLQVAADVLLVPGEGIVRAIARVSGKRFGTCKAWFDLTLIVVATAMSFALLGHLEGVGIGTVASALSVGRLCNLFNDRVPLLTRVRMLSLTSSHGGIEEGVRA